MDVGESRPIGYVLTFYWSSVPPTTSCQVNDTTPTASWIPNIPYKIPFFFFLHEVNVDVQYPPKVFEHPLLFCAFNTRSYGRIRVSIFCYKTVKNHGNDLKLLQCLNIICIYQCELFQNFSSPPSYRKSIEKYYLNTSSRPIYPMAEKCF